MLRPEEVSCEVLRPLLLAASQALGKPITRAVVTVPAYFDDAQRCVAWLTHATVARLTLDLRLAGRPPCGRPGWRAWSV